jgi:MYXO-CTERM domain-containing protein
VATGLTDEGTVVDAFPDATNADRVLVVAAVGGDAGGNYGIYQSLDGATHITTRLYEAAMGDVISGVESSRSHPTTLYATVSRAVEQGFVPGLLRSEDNGTSWKMAALAGLTEGTLRLVAVDPADPATLLLRGHTNAGEFLARTSDGGAHATVVVDLPDGVLTSFARMENGHLFLGGILGLTPVLYTSSDGGATWQRLPSPPQLRALAARAGRLYGAADKNVEEFALAVSDDEGRSWQPVMDYPDVQAIASCAKSACATACQFEADRSVWTEDVCSATAAPKPFADAGAPPPIIDAAADAPADGSHPMSPSSSGCGCAAAGEEASSLWTLTFLGWAMVLAAPLRRRATK